MQERDEGRLAIFVGDDFSGQDLSHITLSECLFNGCRFVATNFRGCAVRNSKFDRCTFDSYFDEFSSTVSQGLEIVNCKTPLGVPINFRMEDKNVKRIEIDGTLYEWSDEYVSINGTAYTAESYNRARREGGDWGIWEMDMWPGRAVLQK